MYGGGTLRPKLSNLCNWADNRRSSGLSWFVGWCGFFAEKVGLFINQLISTVCRGGAPTRVKKELARGGNGRWGECLGQASSPGSRGRKCVVVEVFDGVRKIYPNHNYKRKPEPGRFREGGRGLWSKRKKTRTPKRRKKVGILQ